MSLAHVDLAEWISGFGLTLADGTEASFRLGINMFHSPIRAMQVDSKSVIPSLAVFMNSGGGGVIANSSGAGGPSLRRYVVTVIVRSDVGTDNDLANGQLVADELLRQIHRNPPAGYQQTIASQSQYRWDGFDNNGAHEFSFSVEMMRKGLN